MSKVNIQSVEAISKYFSKRLKELMVENELSQIDLSKIINVQPATISRYTLGIRLPTLTIAVDLAKYFNVSVDYLLGLSDVKCVE